MDAGDPIGGREQLVRTNKKRSVNAEADKRNQKTIFST